MAVSTRRAEKGHAHSRSPPLGAKWLFDSHVQASATYQAKTAAAVDTATGETTLGQNEENPTTVSHLPAFDRSLPSAVGVGYTPKSEPRRQ